MKSYHPKFDLEQAFQPVHLEEAQAFRYKAFGVANETGLHQFINENPEGYASFDVDVTLFSDSELLVKQMSGEYKVKNERMKVLNEELGSVAEDMFASVKFMHIKRGYNSMADRLANDAIDDYFRTQEAI